MTIRKKYIMTNTSKQPNNHNNNNNNNHNNNNSSNNNNKPVHRPKNRDARNHLYNKRQRKQTRNKNKQQTTSFEQEIGKITNNKKPAPTNK